MITLHYATSSSNLLYPETQDAFCFLYIIYLTVVTWYVWNFPFKIPFIHPNIIPKPFKSRSNLNQQIIETWPKICPNLTSAIFSPANAAVGQLPPLAASGTWRFGHLWSTAEEAVGDLKRCPVPRQKLFSGQFFWRKKLRSVGWFHKSFGGRNLYQASLVLFYFLIGFPIPNLPSRGASLSLPKEPLRTVPGPQLWRAAAVPVAAASKLRGLGACQWQRLPGAAAGGSEDVWRTGGTDLVAAELNPCWVDVFFPQTVHPHWGVLTVGVKACAWSGCSLWSAAFYL